MQAYRHVALTCSRVVWREILQSVVTELSSGPSSRGEQGTMTSLGNLGRGLPSLHFLLFVFLRQDFSV